MRDQSRLFADTAVAIKIKGCPASIGMEDLYQAFKKRLAAEHEKAAPIAEHLAGTFQYWLDRQELDAGKELDDDSRLMQLPVNYQRGTIKAWIKALKGEK